MHTMISGTLYVIENTFHPNDIKECTFNDTNWRLHNEQKVFFNLYEFLERINRLDILSKHFDRSEPDMIITDKDFMVMNGKPASSWYSRGKRSKLDEELDFIMQIPDQRDLWNSLKDKRIGWNKQKIYKFHQTRQIEFTPE
ncbi:hypothetical protein [Citrobacter phage Ci1]|nr:hypothetical protein [Citrobacter phage Ci1]